MKEAEGGEEAMTMGGEGWADEGVGTRLSGSGSLCCFHACLVFLCQGKGFISEDLLSHEM